MEKTIQIANRNIGQGEPCFIIAELSANHNRDLNRAKELIHAASECYVDAVKIQTYTQDTLTIDCDNEHFQIKHPVWGGQTLYELYKKAFTPWEWHEELRDYAHEKGLIFFSTAYDSTSVDFLADLNVPVYKVASFELVDTPLLQYIAKKNKPVILSTGMATCEEIELACQTIRREGNDEIILLKCTSSYPAEAEEMNLSGIPALQEKFQTLVGISDHSLTKDVDIAALALGAKVIEKHFILSRKDGGPDAHFSIEPREMGDLVRSVRSIERALEKSDLGPVQSEKSMRGFRKSLFSVEDIRKGEVLTERNIRSIRPADGLAPCYYSELIGKKAKCDIKRGTPLSLKLIEDNAS